MVTSSHVRAGIRALLAMLLISLAAREASAQGCILFRESAPLFGPLSGTYLQPGEWEVTASLRGSTADRHYSGDVYQAQNLPKVPTSLREATDLVEASNMLHQAFGKAVIQHYVHFFRTEQHKFDQVVTSWERERYFERA